MNLATPMYLLGSAVLSANAYSDYIELIFSQYMDTSAVLAISDGMTGVWQGIENSLSKVLHIVKDGFLKALSHSPLTAQKLCRDCIGCQQRQSYCFHTSG